MHGDNDCVEIAVPNGAVCLSVMLIDIRYHPLSRLSHHNLRSQQEMPFAAYHADVTALLMRI